MILVLRTLADTGTITQPQPATFAVALGDLEAFPAPDPLHPLVAHTPTLHPKQGRDPTVAIAVILRRQPHDSGCQPFLIIRLLRDVTLACSRLAQCPAHLALRYPNRQRRLNMQHRLAAAGRA
jgi:hypothetical protein